MGCDIHGVVQVRRLRYDDGKWQTVCHIERDRNYRLFSILAGVRNYEPEVAPIAEPRGLPEGFIVNEEGEHAWSWASDHDEHEWLGDHSQSWCTLTELREWPGWDDKVREGEGGALITRRESVGALFLTWLDYIEQKYKWNDDDEVRFVFGFDS